MMPKLITDLLVALEGEADEFKLLLPQLEPHWSILCRVVEQNKVDTEISNWYKTQIPANDKPTKSKGAQAVVVKHDPPKLVLHAGQKGTDDTSKKVFENAQQTNKRLIDMDDAI